MSACVDAEHPSHPDGYGQQWIDGKLWRSHRHAWTQERGEIPEGHDVHHTCGNRACVNVEHLRLLTHGEHAALTNSARAR